LFKKTLVLCTPLLAVAALAVTPVSASADTFYKCPPGATFVKYCEAVQLCVVPTVQGLRLRQAEALLLAHDCTIGAITLRTNGNPFIAVGRVVGSSPAAGAVRQGGFQVTLLVKKKPVTLHTKKKKQKKKKK
jgi:hypothetical protein